MSMFDTKDVAADLDRLQRSATKDLYGLEPNSALWGDARFRELLDVSERLSFWRWPIATLLAGLSVVPSVPFLVIGYGMRWSLKAVFFWVRRLASFARMVEPFRHA